MPATCITAITETANEASIASDARPPDTDFGSRRPSDALTRNPTTGKRGISASISPLERREGVWIERFAMPEQRNHQRQADGRFGRRHGHHKEHDDLPVHV